MQRTRQQPKSTLDEIFNKDSYIEYGSYEETTRELIIDLDEEIREPKY